MLILIWLLYKNIGCLLCTVVPNSVSRNMFCHWLNPLPGFHSLFFALSSKRTRRGRQSVKSDVHVVERSCFLQQQHCVDTFFHLIHSVKWMVSVMIAHTTCDIQLFIHKCWSGNPPNPPPNPLNHSWLILNQIRSKALTQGATARAG